MGWPNHLTPLPSLLTEPFTYYMIVNSVVDMDMFYSIRRCLWNEIGFSQKFWEVLAHLSEDILWAQLQKYWNPRTFATLQREICRLNHPNFQERLEKVGQGLGGVGLKHVYTFRKDPAKPEKCSRFQTFVGCVQ